MWRHEFEDVLITLNLHALNVLFMLMRMSHPLLNLKTSVFIWWHLEPLCVGDGGSLLMVSMSFMNKNVCSYFHHMKFIFSSIVTKYVVDVWDNTTCSNSIFKPASTLVGWISIVMNSLTPTKIIMKITFHATHRDLMIKCSCACVCIQYECVSTNVHIWTMIAWSNAWKIIQACL